MGTYCIAQLPLKFQQLRMAVIEMENGGQMNENTYGESFLGC